MTRSFSSPPCCTTWARPSTRATMSTAGLAALGDSITERTAWLIAHHPQAAQLREGTLGVLEPAAGSRRPRASRNSCCLCDCDRRGRQRGMPVPDVDDALDYVRDVAQACDEP